MGIPLYQLSDSLRASIAGSVSAASKSASWTRPKRRRRPTIADSGAAQRVELLTWDCNAVPMGKPRMTQRDKWAKRDCVERYHDFADALRASVPDHIRRRLDEASGLPLRLDWTAYMPIPESWPQARAAAAKSAPHTTKPDRDNIDKAVLDSLFRSDSHVYAGHLRKLYDDGNGPRITLTAYLPCK